MTVDLGAPIVAGSGCSGAVVVESPIADVMVEPGPVRVLQLIPATSNEIAWSRVHGTPALRQRWAAASTDLLDLGRAGVDLT